jgi:hypothetical protein
VTHEQPPQSLEVAELAFLECAQTFLASRKLVEDSATILFYANNGYGAVSYVGGMFHSAKIESDFTKHGGRFYEYHLWRGGQGDLMRTTVAHDSFTNRTNGEVSTRSADMFDLSIFSRRIVNPSVQAVLKFQPETVPQPVAKKHESTRRFLGRLPLRRHARAGIIGI